jgi:hypothetical protein
VERPDTERVWQLAGKRAMSKELAIGSVFAVIDAEKATEVRSIVRSASLDVPNGRLLFVIWRQSARQRKRSSCAERT